VSSKCRWEKNQVVTMIGVENLTKSFGDRVLFEGISFQVNPRERVGLVGRNGHGKTTLFRLILGDLSPDAGKVAVPKNYRIAHVQQDLTFTADTVLAEGATGLPDDRRDQLWKVEKILAGLGFEPGDMNRHPAEFSGGYQVRLNLAKVLVSEPDLLLLDEPTNYLDITSIRWIERFLLDWSGEVMLITHDRSFMDRIVTHVLGIHRRKVRKIEGDTEKYYNQVAQDEEIYEKTRLKNERRRRDVELFISRFRAKARLANLVQSRIKTLSKTEKRDKLEKITNLEFSFRSHPFPGKQMMRAENLYFSYVSQRPIVRNFSMSVFHGDRICIVGKNGMGKTTLLRLLAGALSPQSGAVRTHPSAMVGFFEQTHMKTLVDSRTVEEEIAAADPGFDRRQARHICGAMMFSGDDALKKISVLSGGEKSRVMLGRLLATPVNLLLLDEPSNHLDMESCDALLAAIDNFDGALIMVTHNEMFLHAIARRLLVFQADRLEVFEDSYQRFLESSGWLSENRWDLRQPNTGRSPEPSNRLSKKQVRRQRSELLAERARSLRPLEEEMAQIEDHIDALEKRLHDHHADMQTATREGNGESIAEISVAIHTCQSQIDRLFRQLESAGDHYERLKAQFDEKLAQFEAGLSM
jgi:ATP-binding cassette subfamily F protein 3